MEFLVRLVQIHESFRKAELLALGVLANVDVDIVFYDDSTPFCLLRLPSIADAQKLLSRAILSSDIYELWATGNNYEQLHAAAKNVTNVDLTPFQNASFRFEFDSFQGKRDTFEKRDIIESFRYLPLKGPIRMKDPDCELCVFEHFQPKAASPEKLYLGRRVGGSGRDAIVTYNLKKRRYISTTSMDAELSLVTANLTLAAPGKLIYDPFVGTGSFMVTCAHFGAAALGSDIDARSIRGTSGRNLHSNFVQYGTQACFLDSFISDLTNSPLRKSRWLDGIICDPPYGIREGPKVLGHKDGRVAVPVFVDGQAAHLQKDYVPPRRNYGFDDMIADILDFGFDWIVDNGRLSMWVPTANDEDIDLPIPSHPGFELSSSCIQAFNKWSRRLLTYRRLPDADVDLATLPKRPKKVAAGSADDLNRFRKKFFQGFRPSEETPSS